ncbi:MAG: Spy/CpxP family protein refolding chaperone [Flavobacteriales bacterium]|nr:Spy/CpxP family protein refolding chaperone [Flavobacteriales bacterium]
MKKLFSTIALTVAVVVASNAQNISVSEPNYHNNAKYNEMLSSIPNLTDDQKSQIDGFIEAFIEVKKSAQAELEKLDAQESKYSNAASSSLSAEELSKKRASVEDGVVMARKSMEEQVRGVLTENQQKALDAKRKSK